MVEFLKQLETFYPPNRLLLDPAQKIPYESDGLTAFRASPQAVVLFTTTDEVIQTVKLCHQYKVPFVARGSGTSLSGGSLPVEAGIVIGLNKLNRILEINPDNRTARVEPGVVNLKVSQSAARYNLYYAPDPSSQPICTIGGNVAFNSGNTEVVVNRLAAVLDQFPVSNHFHSINTDIVFLGQHPDRIRIVVITFDT